MGKSKEKKIRENQKMFQKIDCFIGNFYVSNACVCVRVRVRVRVKFVTLQIKNKRAS